VEDRVIGEARVRAALGAWWLVLATTASWWALALWPVGPAAPEWLLRTRDVCFGAKGDALPGAGGWLLLIGQPVGMLGLLVAVWGAELRAGLVRVLARAGGQVMVGVMLALTVSGLVTVAARVREGNLDSFVAGSADAAAQLTRVNDPAPAMTLVDQAGHEIALASYRGRRVIVAFAYAHCETVCPLVVSDVLAARARFDRDPPVALVVTLDPWRDTPGRLATIATQWGLDGEAHVLSGDPDAVERTLSAWRVPRARNLKTGDISHPAIVYVIGADGRIAYVVSGGADAISAAVRAL
jgi:cytochrome oxidase Cu insertion factor (SCO1/SenC/PrrC family)